jgi:hypothetical protein
MKQLGVIVLFLILFFQALYASEQQKLKAAIDMRYQNESMALGWVAAQHGNR